MGKLSRKARKLNKQVRKKIANEIAPPVIKAGTSYLFTYPFWFFVDTASKPTVVEITIKNTLVRFYPPFRSAPANFISMPFINPHNIPINNKTRLRVDAKIKDMAAIPLLRENEGITMRTTLTREWKNPPAKFPMDSIRIDILGDIEGNEPEELSVKLINQLRWRSRQWWIGRSSDVSSGHIRNSFDISTEGEPISILDGIAKGRTVAGFEIAIDDSVWQASINDIKDTVEAPLYDVLLLDSYYFAAAKDIRRSVLDLATACEVTKNITFERLNLQKDGTDLLKHLSITLEKQINRSYEKEENANYSIIKDLWIARGNIAHGKIEYRYNGQTVVIDDRRVIDFAKAAENCVRWLEAL